MNTNSTLRDRITRQPYLRTLLRGLTALVTLILLSLPASALTVKVDVGRPSKGCSGFGICKITIDFAASAGVPADFRLNGDRLTVNFLEPAGAAGERPQTLPIDEPLKVDPAVARALGARELTILPGAYTVDYSTNPNGTVQLNTSRIGVSIHVEAGRRSKGCTGFGICSITIDIELAERAGGVGTLEGNVLTVDFGKKVSGEGPMIIDEAIELDAETARALGAKKVTVLPGAYEVDYSSNPNGTVHLNTMRIGVTIEVEVGRRSRGCTGFGICSVTIGFDFAADRTPAVGTLDGNVLTVDFGKKVSGQGAMIIDEAIELDPATANALGARKVTILPGAYEVDYSSNPNGTVHLNTMRIGVTIGIDVGRRSKDCTGFGICSITISFDLATKTAGVGTLDGNVLTVDFQKKVSGQGPMIIDEAIELDAATAQALGAKKVTVLPGAYEVDYSSNPNGTVHLNTMRIGVTVTIDVGRRSKDCTGFGICSITIGFDFAADRTPAVGTLDGNVLTVDFGKKVSGEGAMIIDEAIELDAETAWALGAKKVTILPGAYEVDYSSNPNGTVHLNTMRIGVTVTIEVGRRSRGCTGFGICSITVGVDFAERTPAVGTLDGNVLTIDFGKKVSGEGAMIIDEPIELDPATAQAFGVKRLVVKPGAYEVDYSSNPNGTVRLSVMRVGITIHVEIGRKSQGCMGFGICSITVSAEAVAKEPSLGSLNGNVLTVEFGTKVSGEGAMIIDEPIELDAATARALGAERLVVKPGAYKVDYSSNPNGTVHLNVMRIGITIGIDVGRPSRDCRGLGICSITIGFDFSARTVPAIASLNDSTLGLAFTSPLPEDGNVFTVEEDVLLDSAIARGLEASRLVIRKGEYTIGRDSLGRPYVELPVNRIGIGVTIYIGRASRDCTGFGICKVVLSADFSARALRSVASMEKGMLTLEFDGKGENRDSALVIDEAIELDADAAFALGIRTILPGSYPVVYDEEGNGRVSLFVRSAETSSAATTEGTTTRNAARAVPNPTSGTTTISYTTTEEGRVTMVLTGVNGNEVMRLVDEPMEAGTHSVTFDGGSLPAGVYYYTIRTASGTESGSVIVAR